MLFAIILPRFQSSCSFHPHHRADTPSPTPNTSPLHDWFDPGYTHLQRKIAPTSFNSQASNQGDTEAPYKHLRVQSTMPQ